MPHKKPTHDEDNHEYAQHIAELTAALQRERADAINIRRHHDEQLATLRVNAKAQLVKELLPIIDNFERALQHVPRHHRPQPAADVAGQAMQPYIDWVAGVKKIVAQFEKTLANLGVERIKTVGEPFDPRYHEAISMEDGGDGTQEIVSEEIQSGYKLGDDVIRPAMVRVRG